jgi:integrase
VKIEGKNPNDLLTKEEIDRMINMADEGRDQAIMSVLAESGCRVGELVSSKIGDVGVGDDFTRLTFRRGKTGLRTVPLKESIVYLNRWLAKHPLSGNPDASLWVSLNQIPLTRGSKVYGFRSMNENTVLVLVKRVAKKAGIKKNVHPHLFRHTCATELAKEWTEPMMRTYLGWDRNSPMPSVYTHLAGSDLEDAQRKRLGMVKSDEPELKFKNCPRCKTEMPARVEFCTVCGEVMNKNKVQTIEDGLRDMVSEEIRDMVKEMFFSSPDKFNLIRSKLVNQK